MDPGLFLLATGSFIVAAAALIISWRAALAEERFERVLGMVEPTPDDAYSRQLEEPLAVRLLKPLGRGLSGTMTALLPANWLTSVRRDLELAGLRRVEDVDVHVAARLVSLGVGAASGVLLGTLVGGGAGFALGVIVAVLVALLPKVRVSRLRAERTREIRRHLGDVLDLLAISVEAGAGLEQAIQTVSDHFGSVLGAELRQTLKEMEVGLTRREALERLKRRTEVQELNNFVVALVQADVLGMPLSRVLRAQADAMRMRRRQIARETAAKLPVKLVFPLVILILPALFVVVLGPAAIAIARTLY